MSVAGVACRSVVTVDYDLGDAGDTELCIECIEKVIRSRAGKLGASAVHCRKSSSGKGLHCVICFPHELSEEERLALSILFMDDPKRIMWMLYRYVTVKKLVDILFVYKDRLASRLLYHGIA